MAKYSSLNQNKWVNFQLEDSAYDAGTGQTKPILQVVGGIYRATQPTYTDGDAAMLHFSSDGKLMVDTELTLNADNVTVGNLKVGSTDQTSVNSRWIKTDTNGVVAVSASSDIPTSIVGGTKTVTTAGVREALGASTSIKSVYIRATSTNTGLIYVGGVTVTSANGISLAANDSVELSIANLATVYLDSSVNGEGVGYTYFA
jgi:hypothetical protein